MSLYHMIERRTHIVNIGALVKFKLSVLFGRCIFGSIARNTCGIFDSSTKIYEFQFDIGFVVSQRLAWFQYHDVLRLHIAENTACIVEEFHK